MIVNRIFVSLIVIMVVISLEYDCMCRLSGGSAMEVRMYYLLFLDVSEWKIKGLRQFSVLFGLVDQTV